MMGRQTVDQARLFYEFHLDDRIPRNHLLRRINPITVPRTSRKRSVRQCQCLKANARASGGARSPSLCTEAT